jgi:hypothetical protein
MTADLAGLEFEGDFLQLGKNLILATVPMTPPFRPPALRNNARQFI